VAFEEPVTVFGEVSATFFAASTAEDTDFEVAALPGRSERHILGIADGIVRASWRESYARTGLYQPGHAPSLIEPGRLTSGPRRRATAAWYRSPAEPSEDLAVPDIAENLGVSVRTLQLALRSETGATPTELLRRVRLDRAREMLLEAEPGEQTIVSIAERCGFSHQGRFSAVYLDTFGELPSASLRR
jgi:AraC-like DNA-binding protein